VFCVVFSTALCNKFLLLFVCVNFDLSLQFLTRDMDPKNLLCGYHFVLV